MFTQKFIKIFDTVQAIGLFSLFLEFEPRQSLGQSQMTFDNLLGYILSLLMRTCMQDFIKIFQMGAVGREKGGRRREKGGGRREKRGGRRKNGEKEAGEGRKGHPVPHSHLSPEVSQATLTLMRMDSLVKEDAQVLLSLHLKNDESNRSMHLKSDFTLLGEEGAGLIVHLFVSYAHVNLCHFFSSAWYQGMAATSCGSSWTFLFFFFFVFVFQFKPKHWVKRSIAHYWRFKLLCY